LGRKVLNALEREIEGRYLKHDLQPCDALERQDQEGLEQLPLADWLLLQFLQNLDKFLIQPVRETKQTGTGTRWGLHTSSSHTPSLPPPTPLSEHSTSNCHATSCYYTRLPIWASLPSWLVAYSLAVHLILQPLHFSPKHPDTWSVTQHTDAKALERVQKRFTRMVPGMGNYNEVDRLERSWHGFS